MKVTVEEIKPAPPPPKEIVIRLTEHEALLLRTATYYACTASRTGEINAFLNQLDDALAPQVEQRLAEWVPCGTLGAVFTQWRRRDEALEA